METSSQKAAIEHHDEHSTGDSISRDENSSDLNKRNAQHHRSEKGVSPAYPLNEDDYVVTFKTWIVVSHNMRVYMHQV